MVRPGAIWSPALVEPLTQEAVEQVQVVRGPRQGAHGDHRCGESRGGHAASDESGRDPLTQAEGAGEELADGVPWAASNDLLVYFTLAGRVFELGKRRSDRRCDRVFADEAADVLRSQAVEGKIPRRQGAHPESLLAQEQGQRRSKRPVAGHDSGVALERSGVMTVPVRCLVGGIESRSLGIVPAIRPRPLVEALGSTSRCLGGHVACLPAAHPPQSRITPMPWIARFRPSSSSAGERHEGEGTIGVPLPTAFLRTGLDDTEFISFGLRRLPAVAPGRFVETSEGFQQALLLSTGSNSRAKIVDKAVKGLTPHIGITDADDRCGVHRRDSSQPIGPAMHLAPLFRDPE